MILEGEKKRERVRDRDRERERERNTDRLPPIHSPPGDRTCNLGMCPDWKLNPHIFGAWDDAPTN